MEEKVFTQIIGGSCFLYDRYINNGFQSCSKQFGICETVCFGQGRVIS